MPRVCGSETADLQAAVWDLFGYHTIACVCQMLYLFTRMYKMRIQ